MTNPLIEMQRLGQSPWHDNIRRQLLTSGKLKKMVKDGDITGLTSNPTIFEQAIAGSTDYDETIEALARDDRVRVVVPAPVVPLAAGAGLAPDRLVGAVPGRPLTVGDVTVHPVPALHGVHVADAYSHGLPGDGGQVRYLGYVLETPAGRLYHAGDTLRWPGQAELLRGLGVEVALLPVNGRDARREALDIVGNLDGREALELVRDAAVPTLVPMHYDLMEGNLGDLGELVRLAPELHPGGRVAVLERMAETPLASLVAT